MHRSTPAAYRQRLDDTVRLRAGDTVQMPRLTVTRIPRAKASPF
jgi:hypothetical protein